MAESSKQSAGLDKQLLGAKNEPRKESKRKRKRSKKAARAQSNETLESQMKNEESLACDEKNVSDNNEDSKLNTKETPQTVSASDTSGTANISEELNPPDNEKMTKEVTTQGHGNHEECGINKDVQQDLQTIQEQGSEERETNSEQIKQDHAGNKGKFAFHRSKKVKISMSKSPADEDKHQSDPSGESTAVNIVAVEENTKTAEEQTVYKSGTAKLETSASSADNENEEASKSPEGMQEKPLSKNNKGKKLKQLASFGRNKKKYDIASKLDETSTETHKENLVDTPGRFERSRSTSSQPFQTTEIVGNESKEPVAVISDFTNENTNDGEHDETEIEKKRGGKQKKKGSVLGFRRSKPLPKRKQAKSEDEQNTEGSPSKESDAVSVSKSGEVEKNNAEFEESNEDSKANQTEAADLKTEETSGAAAEMTQEVSNKEEMKSAESKETVATAQEDSNQVTPKKEKKENILRRRLRKLRSPGNILQGRKKSHEDEKSVEGTGDGLNTSDQADTRASSDLEQTAEEQTPVAEGNDEEQCSDQEEISKAVKRKTSDLNSTTTQALKKKKEDGENTIEVEDNEELPETALAVVKEKDEQNIYEEVNALNDQETVKEVKDLAEEKEQSVDELNKEMPQEKNVMEEHQESEIDEEISREALAHDDTKTEEELLKEAQRKSQKLMQTVINELTELLKKKAEEKAAEIAMQVEEREERVEFSDRENTVTAKQLTSAALDDTGLEHEPDEEESYDSDVTVVTVKRLSSHESLVEHKTEPNAEDEEIRAIAEEKALETEAPREAENDIKQETEDEGAISFIEEVSSGTETSAANNEDSQVEPVHVPEKLTADPRAEHKTEPGTEGEEVHDINEAGKSSETEPNPEDSMAVNIKPEELMPESGTEHDTEPGIEGEGVKDFTDASESSKTETSTTKRKGSKSKGRTLKAKVLKNESKVSDDSDELETITKANEQDERKEDVGQSKEDSCLMESYQTPSCQNSVEEWILVHRVDLTQEISRQIKHSLVFNSLKRSYTSCCTIM